MDLTEGSETSEKLNRTPGKYPKIYKNQTLLSRPNVAYPTLMRDLSLCYCTLKPLEQLIYSFFLNLMFGWPASE
jgi:hypothetical protein